ncbi:hypothetical protein IU438_19115 [Nocardia cyriacigeorgica]|uniref:hypothetical protein n=1 Tax=Nocardia cyriacigeorgica TaxID=135487 RepID=UPI0018940F8E|nr:hypothetical protein [Nocardia cyriacigeorgica]MBF6397905.1 hypothetical protein [Nocardia cyriacigeorgica]MBF6402438.1 hypothetical protein [Nocardia cyriacigeorgica]
MGAEEAAPCRHAGAPPQTIVSSVSQLIQSLGDDSSLLDRYGLTSEEYRTALPAAIEGLRGSMSASVSNRRTFLFELLQAMAEAGYIDRVERPKYGENTVYRVRVPDFGDVAVIQKGCPDGKHSSANWSVPEWARETYLWWLCDSMRYEPGAHIDKGAKRLRQEFFSDRPDALSGVIFHNHLCGTVQRRCPKMEYSLHLGDIDLPPPCVYIMPDRGEDASGWNWGGETERRFPAVLLGAFGIPPELVSHFVGHIGFQQRNGALRTTIASRFGTGRVTTFRS